jgi:NAD(P)-dependent dehydrogenase (short-subunit alcohol dehydrogenase family)
MGASIELAREGYFVIASMRNAHRETPLHAYIKEEHLDNIEIIEMDVTSEEEIATKVAEVASKYGKIDVLINNAGYAEGGLVEDIGMEAYRKQFETNFFGLVAVTKAVLPVMRKQKEGKIINISSVSGRTGFPCISPYVSSKFAVEGFSECLRLEMLPYGVFVTLIEPGPYRTGIWAKGFVNKDSAQKSADEEMLSSIMKEIEKSAKNASDPKEVIDLLMRVIETKRPRLRYLVGKGMKQLLTLRKIVPERWFEQMLIMRLSNKKRG